VKRVVKRIFSLFSRKGREPAEKPDEMHFIAEPELNYDRNPFLHSLSSLKPEDIRVSETVRLRTRAQKKENLFRNVMLFFCLSVFVVSCVLLLDNLRQKNEAKKLYDDAAAEFAAAGLDFGFEQWKGTQISAGGSAMLLSPDRESIPSLSGSEAGKAAEQEKSGQDGNTGNSGYNEELEKLRATLRSYRERNDDVYGYISIPAVGIEYVLVKGEDNDFYLDNNWLGQYLVNGSIFVDYRCADMIMHNFNTVIYGHNIVVNGGSMFNGVTKFRDREIFNNALIYVYTMDGVYVYKPFSFYDTTSSSGYVRTGFSSEEDFLGFAADMKSRSRHASDLTVEENGRMLTLSTCTNVGSGRYALHAVLIEYIV